MLRTRTSIDTFISASERAVHDAEGALGRTMRGGRFHQYLRIIGQVGAQKPPAGLPWARGAEERSIFFEAVSQLQALQYWKQVLCGSPEPLVREKLKTVLGGPVLPSQGVARDPARDTLAEIVAARVLQGRGFRVELSEHEEDLLAYHPGSPVLVVECKRPAQGERILNVGKSRS